MKNLIIILVTVFPFFTLAFPVTSFNCVSQDVLEGQKPTRIQFKVSDLNTKQADYYVSSDKEEYPVKMTPKNSVLMLNDNFSITQTATRLMMESDGDGCQLTYFVLYKNTGYTRGYVNIRPMGGCGAASVYSNVLCKVKTTNQSK
jgi:hypothetical protein